MTVHRQGTGAVTLACIMSAVGVTKSKLADQRFVIYGAGSAGLGIARQLRDGVVAIDGANKDAVNKQFYLLDKHGLIKDSLGAENIREGWNGEGSSMLSRASIIGSMEGCIVTSSSLISIPGVDTKLDDGGT